MQQLFVCQREADSKQPAREAPAAKRLFFEEVLYTSVSQGKSVKCGSCCSGELDGLVPCCASFVKAAHTESTMHLPTTATLLRRLRAELARKTADRRNSAVALAQRPAAVLHAPKQARGLGKLRGSSR